MSAATRVRSVISLVACGLLAGCVGSVRVHVGHRSDRCTRDFGTSTAAQKIETYLAASAALERESIELSREIESVCADAARAGAAHATGAAAEPGQTEAFCADVREWFASEVLALGDSVRLESVPGECSSSEESYVTCVSRCELRIRPTDVNPVIDAQGVFDAPEASPRCRASCGTLSAIEARCGPATAAVIVTDGGSVDPERLARLRSLWERAAPELIRLSMRAERLLHAARRLVEIAPILPRAAATLSIRAVECVSDAAPRVEGAAQRLHEAAGHPVSASRPQLR